MPDSAGYPTDRSATATPRSLDAEKANSPHVIGAPGPIHGSDVTPAAVTSWPVEVTVAPPAPRTIAIVATELEAATVDLATAERNVAERRAEIERLTKEMHALLGRKPRKRTEGAAK